MRILCCPDKFAGTLSAPEVAKALAAGWVQVADDELICRPLADGGPGFLSVLRELGGAVVDVPTVDPLGRPTSGAVLLVGDTAYLESAQACGVHLLARGEQNPMITTSRGLGLLVRAALGLGAKEIVVGLGGSATNDAGAGMLAALGAVPVDAAGVPLPPGGAALASCRRLEGVPELSGAALVAAVDVDNPLTGLYGASSVFGPQKGASREDVLVLDAALESFAGVLERDLPGCPSNLAGVAGGGAAGGLGTAVLALGGGLASGIDLVADLVGLDEAIAGADVVVTGEGRLDAQSLRGKVLSGVAARAAEYGVPCVVVAGQSTIGRREAAAAGIAEIHSLVEYFGDVGHAMSEATGGLFAIGGRLAQQWSRLSR